MKLLSLRLCDHDSNISYWDGSNLHYIKTERMYGIKHHCYNNLWEWEQEIYDIWGIKKCDLDDICIILDEWKYNSLDTSLETFFPTTPVQLQNPSLHGVDRLNHHYAHALSSWMLTKKSDVDIVIDAFGDRDVSWSVFKDETLISIGDIKAAGSLGWAMGKAAKIVGVEASNFLDLAGKLMGIQSYGIYDEQFASKIYQFGIDKCNQLFDYSMWEDYVGDKTLANLTKLNWIHTVHEVAGDQLVKFFSQFADKSDVITFSGGVAQNVVWNTKLKEHFPNLIIPPHCADDGLSLGGIEWLRRKHNLPNLKLDRFPYIQSDEAPEDVSDSTIQLAARALARGETVGWYQHNGEVGPRALGNRSILIDPRLRDAKQIANKIKRREEYRPFGASVLQEEAHNIFEESFESPYMLYVLKTHRSDLLSITHVDGTCRVQTVEDDNSSYRKLLDEFYRITGCPLLLNTSLNVAGRGIAGNKREALQIFFETPIQNMFIGNQHHRK